jgi:hypothetical protein
MRPAPPPATNMKKMSTFLTGMTTNNIFLLNVCKNFLTGHKKCFKKRDQDHQAFRTGSSLDEPFMALSLASLL